MCKEAILDVIKLPSTMYQSMLIMAAFLSSMDPIELLCNADASVVYTAALLLLITSNFAKRTVQSPHIQWANVCSSVYIKCFD